MAGLCRLCAETRPLEKMSEITDPALNIEQKLVDCCRWTHFKEFDSKGNLNSIQHICIVCMEKLEQCWLFAENVASAQYKLIEIIGSSKWSAFDENAQKFKEDTANDSGERVDTSPKTPAEIIVYVEIGENQQINIQDIDENPIEHQSDECIKIDRSTTSKKNTKKIPRVKSQSRDKCEKRSHQLKLNQNEGDQCTNEEKLSESLNCVSNFPRILRLHERNDDGTVNSDTIQRLGLVNWMVLQHQCSVCFTCFCSNYELKAHFTSEHSLNDLRYMCSMCKSTGRNSYRRRAHLLRHTVRKHLPHLKYW